MAEGKTPGGAGPSGRVRQFFEEYSEEEQAWKPWFEGFYSRIDPAAMP